MVDDLLGGGPWLLARLPRGTLHWEEALGWGGGGTILGAKTPIHALRPDTCCVLRVGQPKDRQLSSLAGPWGTGLGELDKDLV